MNYHPEFQYLNLLSELLDQPPREDRTGTGTHSVFGRRMEFDLAEEFPLFTTKKLPFKTIAYELLWFVRGLTNTKWLKDRGVTIWDNWADRHGDLGPVYGHQWRNWNGKDQLEGVLESLRSDPYGRRHIVSAWNVSDLPDMALPPCHILFQFYVENNGRLSLQLYQRSADAFLGLPFNIASYALLLRMAAHMLGRKSGKFIWSGGDVHLYRNHVEQARLQIAREPVKFPVLACGTTNEMFGEPCERHWDDWSIEHLGVLAYHPHPHIPGSISI